LIHEQYYNFDSSYFDPISNGLEYGKTYYYQVAFTSLDGIGPRSSTISASPIIPAVTGFMATPDGLSIQFTWDAIPGIPEYEVRICSYETELIESTSVIGTTESLSFSFEDASQSRRYYYVVAKVGEQLGKLSEGVRASVDTLARPTNFSGEFVDFDTVRLSWDAVEGATSYNIYRSIYSVDSDDLILTGVTGTSVEISEFLSTTDVMFGIKAVRSNGETSYLEDLNNALDVPRLPSLQDFAIQNRPDLSSLELTWEPLPVDGVTYQIYSHYRSMSSLYSSYLIGSTQESSFTHEGLVPGDRGYYQVRAIYGNPSQHNSRKSLSGELKGWVMQEPTGVLAVENSGSTVIQWSYSSLFSDTIEAVIEKSTDGGNTYSLVARVPATDKAWVDSNTEFGNTYYYRVSFGDGAITTSSIEASILISGIVGGLEASVEDHIGEIHISWSPVSGAEFYKIYHSHSSNGTYNLLADNLIDTSYIHDGLAKGFDRYYKVSAVVDGQELDRSEAVHGRTWALPPTGLEATKNYGADYIQIHWNPVDHAEGYKVYFQINMDGRYYVLQDNYGNSIINGTSVIYTPNSMVGVYEFYVSAVRDGLETYLSPADLAN
jgi:fibronectin type 3 domain-containing protein